MSAEAVMAIVLFIFFLVGFAIGIIVVMALSARKADKAARRVQPVTPPPAIWPYLPESDPDDEGPDEPPWRQRHG